MDEGSYNFKVFSPKTEKYEPWTGFFKTEELAQDWWFKWGEFHVNRGHSLALFHGGERINPKWMNKNYNLKIMINEKKAPFSFSEIEDVRIIIKANGKNYAITTKKEVSKEDAKSIRIALVSVLLEDHDIVVPSLEEINVKPNE